MEAYEAARDYLYGLKHRGANYGVDRMTHFVAALGHPERRYPIIHVAGTNGKGSTCAMLESILRYSGLRTGLFTSPHLVHQGERVQVNRRILSHAAIARYTAYLKPIAEQIEREHPGHHPTFFEFMTGMALLCFKDQRVDVGILETGLGGRLDATNVVDPLVSVITSIGLDHTDILGPTLAHIAREKAGIIKPRRPVVMGLVPSEAEAVIREVAADKKAPLYSVREVLGEDESRFPVSGLPGTYQRRNAATAALTVQVIRDRFAVSEAASERGLAEVKWPGRWETHQLQDKSLILDATHNEEGAAYLAENLRSLVSTTGRKPVVVTGTLGELRAASLIPTVCQFAREVHLIEARQPRACTFAELEAFVPRDFTGPIVRNTVTALFPQIGECTVGEPGEIVVATGSIYLIGEILDALHHGQTVREDVLQD